MRINIHRAGVDVDPTLFIIPFFVGGIAGFLIGHMKDNWLKLNSELEFLVEQRTEELQNALKEIKTLSGILPICASCKKIRDDKGYWKQVETYIKEHSDAEFSHGMCGKCAEKLYGDQEWFDEVRKGEEIASS
jgi:hypothetical protein